MVSIKTHPLFKKTPSEIYDEKLEKMPHNYWNYQAKISVVFPLHMKHARHIIHVHHEIRGDKREIRNIAILRTINNNHRVIEDCIQSWCESKTKDYFTEYIQKSDIFRRAYDTSIVYTSPQYIKELLYFQDKYTVVVTKGAEYHNWFAFYCPSLHKCLIIRSTDENRAFLFRFLLKNRRHNIYCTSPIQDIKNTTSHLEPALIHNDVTKMFKHLFQYNTNHHLHTLPHIVSTLFMQNHVTLKETTTNSFEFQLTFDTNEFVDTQYEEEHIQYMFGDALMTYLVFKKIETINIVNYEHAHLQYQHNKNESSS